MDIKSLINVEEKEQGTSYDSLSDASSLESSASDKASLSPRSSPKLLDKIQGSPKVLNTIRKIKKKGIYKCSHCSTHFPDFIALAKHYDEFNIKREFFCPKEECPWHVIGLPNKNELNRHFKSQHQPRQFACRMGCDYKFHRADTRNRHEKQVHLNQNSRLNKSQRNKRLKIIHNNNNNNNNNNDIYDNNNDIGETRLKLRSNSNELPEGSQYIEQQIALRRAISLPLIPILQLPYTYGYPAIPPPEAISFGLRAPIQFQNHIYNQAPSEGNFHLPNLQNFYFGANNRAA